MNAAMDSPPDAVTPAGSEAPLRTLACLSGGVWRLRPEIERLTGARLVRPKLRLGSLDRPDAVIGWGHKATAASARSLARRHGCPYLAMEDGFLRSVVPGPGSPSVSYVLDRTGIYYDARGPSDLEALISGAEPTGEEILAARSVIARLKSDRLSKYNAGSADPRALGALADRDDLVLVIDQTVGDASVAGALADAASFDAMLDEAIARHGRDRVVVKTHPDVIRGTKRGFMTERARREGLALLSADVEPGILIERSERVYVVSSLFGFEALVGGKPVTCHGMPFYAGWGLTDDRVTLERRSVARSLEHLVWAAYLRYGRYLDPWYREEIDFFRAADAIVELRTAFRRNARPVVTAGMSGWKRRAVRSFLTGMGGPPVHAKTAGAAAATARRLGGIVALWGADAPAPADAECVRLEDGFIRSAGLGLLGTPPASLIVDGVGLYMDSSRPSGFEALVAETQCSPPDIDRARRLRAVLVASRLSKYNVGTEVDLPGGDGRRRILVPGQVEDDASIRLGSPVVRSNADLVRAVRERHPGAFIAYKPHPDVGTGLRPGAVDASILSATVDMVIHEADISRCLEWADHVETMTSLAGFEALLRGRTVTTHGQPFYAGWGLTEDLAPVERRRRVLEIDELVHFALVAYPRYVDPRSGLPAPVEVVVRRIAEERARTPTTAERALSLYRRSVSVVAHRWIEPIGRLARRGRSHER
jgi:capsular polysaccharide export protein